MTANLASVLMALGALVWLIGELRGVSIKGDEPDTTTDYVRGFLRRQPRVLAVTLVVSGAALLAVHFLTDL